MSNPDESFEQWLAQWLDSVAVGAATMSQRKLSSITRRGDLANVERMARARGVHLLLLADDRGEELVAASVHPFRTIC